MLINDNNNNNTMLDYSQIVLLIGTITSTIDRVTVIGSQQHYYFIYQYIYIERERERT